MITPWNVGIASVCITPDEPIWLHGWSSREQPSQSVQQDIFVKAMAMKHQDSSVAVLVTTDLLGFSKGMVRDLVRELKKRHHVERANLILNASHNHCSPVMTDVLPLYFDLSSDQTAVVERYTAQVYDRILQAVAQAIDNLAPAIMKFGQSFAGFAVNRRRTRPRGRPLPNVVDHDVPVLKVETPEGNLRAVVFGYACHTTTINQSTINGDYAGYAQSIVEQMHNGATAMFVAGCGADANPIPRFRTGLGELYGRILAYAVDDALNAPMQLLPGPLCTAHADAILPFEQTPTPQQLLQMLPGRQGLEKREVQNLLYMLERGQTLPNHCRFPITAWRFGQDLTLIALTGETVADYALRFKQTYGWDNTWVCGYNNELLAYVPSKRVRQEGGYEGCSGMMEYGHPSAFTPEIEDIIANTVDSIYPRSSGILFEK